MSLRAYGHSDDLDEAIPVVDEAAAAPADRPSISASLRRVRASVGTRTPRVLPVADHTADGELIESGELDSGRVQNALTALLASLGNRKLSDFRQRRPRPIFIDAIFALPSEKVIVTLGGSSETGFRYTEITEAIEKNMLTTNEKS